MKGSTIIYALLIALFLGLIFSAGSGEVRTTPDVETREALLKWM